MPTRHVPKTAARLLRGVAVAALAAATLQASATLVTTRVALSANDFVEWGQLGAEDVSPLVTPASITSNLGVNGSASNAGGDLYRFDEGGLWGGNFAVGAELIGTLLEPGPIVVDFAIGLSKVGAQIQAADYGAFGGIISVFGSAANLLETYTVNGMSNGNADDSAIFIGVSRLTADIFRVEFNVSGTPNMDFAINRLDLSVDGVVNGVPEPASWALAGFALAALARTRKRRLPDAGESAPTV